jgi:WD40 repeat protein
MKALSKKKIVVFIFLVLLVFGLSALHLLLLHDQQSGLLLRSEKATSTPSNSPISTRTLSPTSTVTPTSSPTPTSTPSPIPISAENGSRLVPLRQYTQNMAISTGLQWLAFKDIGRKIILRDYWSGISLFQFNGSDFQIPKNPQDWFLRDRTILTFSPDSLFLESCETDGFRSRMVLWNTSTGNEVMNVEIGECGSYSPDRQRLVEQNYKDGVDYHSGYVINIRGVPSGKIIKSIDCEVPPPGLCLQPEFSPDGKYFAYSVDNPNVESDEIVVLRDAETFEVVHKFSGYFGQIVRIAFSPDSRWVVTADRWGFIIVWDINTGERLKLICRDYSYGVTFYYPEATLIETGLTKYEFTSSLTFSPDNNLLVVGFHEGGFILWDLFNLEPLIVLDQYDALRSISFSADGSLLMVNTEAFFTIWGLPENLDRYPASFPFLP